MIYNGFDPVEDGLIASYARPGGNGPACRACWAKRTPSARTDQGGAAAGASPRGARAHSPAADRQAKFENAFAPARAMPPVELTFFWYGNQDELESTFPAMEGKGIQGFVLTPQPYTFQSATGLQARDQTSPARRFHVEGIRRSGGLMSYGPDWPLLLRQHARYVDRILRGASAPSSRSNSHAFELVINLNTAAALGLKIPQRCCCAPTRESSDIGRPNPIIPDARGLTCRSRHPSIRWTSCSSGT